MHVAVVCAPQGTYKPLAAALVKGIEAAGDRASPIAITAALHEYDAVACWGWRVGKRIRRTNPAIPILVMERGYVGDRFHWTSLGWNGLNRRAIFPSPKPNEENKISRRWLQNFGVGIYANAWRKPSEPGYALILGQVQADQACVNVNLAYQYRAWAALLARRGWEVKFRPHPKALMQATGLRSGTYTRGTLAEDLAGAAFTVSWNSNSSVDSVLAGVPSVTLDEGAMAWDVTSHDLNEPVTMPSRTEWAAQLAWCQWQPSELTDGTAWKAVREVKP